MGQIVNTKVILQRLFGVSQIVLGCAHQLLAVYGGLGSGQAKGSDLDTTGVGLFPNIRAFNVYSRVKSGKSGNSEFTNPGSTMEYHHEASPYSSMKWDT